MRTTVAFVCAVVFGACAAGNDGGDGGDDQPTVDAAVQQQAVCGDGTCAAGEIGACVQDCGAPSPCPNGTCDVGETNISCPMDCPAAGPICGDTICDMAGGENSTNCPGDCMGGGGALDCNDPNVALSCFFCASDPTQCSALGVDPAGCATCGF